MAMTRQRGVAAAAAAMAAVLALTAVVLPATRGEQREATPVSRAIAATETVRTTSWSAVAVADLHHGEQLDNGYGHVPVNAASIAKLLTAVDVLDQADLTRTPLTEADRNLISRALIDSDDSAMSTLWAAYGGHTGIDRTARRLGLTGTFPPYDPTRWGTTRTTAADVLRLYRHIVRELPGEERDLLLTALRGAAPVAADGFRQDYGLLAPTVAEPGIAVKQGWMCCDADVANVHSTGVLAGERFVVAVLTQQNATPEWQTETHRLVDELAEATVSALPTGVR